MNLNEKYSDKAVWQIPDNILLVKRSVLHELAERVIAGDILPEELAKCLTHPEYPLFQDPPEHLKA